MIIKKCLWCKSESLKKTIKRKDGNQVMQCQNCGLLMIEEISENLDNLYKKDYFEKIEDDKFMGYKDYLSSPVSNVLGKFAFIKLFISKDFKKYLDIGCADGSLVELFNNYKYESYGLDISKDAVKEGIQKGLNVSVSNLKQIFFNKQEFDFISAFDLIEHLDTPKETLTEVKRVLKDGGIFFYSTLCVNEISENEFWFNNSLEHIIYYDKIVLTKLIEEVFGVQNVANIEIKINGITEIIGIAKKEKISDYERKIFDTIINGKIFSEDVESNYFLSLLYNQLGKFVESSLAIQSCNFDKGKEEYVFLNFINLFYQGKFFDAVKLINDYESKISLSNSIFWQTYSYILEIIKDLEKKDLIIRNDHEILLKEKIILDKDKRLYEKNMIISEIENKNVALENINSELKNAITTLEDSNIALKNIIIELKNELAESNKEIYLIKSSITWKLRGFYFKMKSNLNPLKFLYLVKKAILILKRDGVVIFLNRLNKLSTKYHSKFKKVNKSKKIIKKIQEKWPSDKPLVSIVTAYYNAGSTINETIKSIFSQTFQDFEYIIVDDGSTDEESKKIFDLIDNTRTRKIKEDNHGPAFARNNGIAHAKGKYILCLDADDTIDSTYLEKLILVLELNPQYDIAYSDINLFGNIVGVYNLPDFDPYKLFESNILTCASIFKKELWKNVGGYKSGIGFEDWEFWINLVENGAQPKHVLGALFNYRKANNSRFVDDSKKINENIKKIRELHPNYSKNIKKLSNSNVSIKFEFEKGDKYSNINNSKKYLEKSEKKSILILMPWLTFGGAETLIYNYCSKINKDFNISIITGLKNDNEWEYKFKKITENIYHLPNLFENENDYLYFIINYIKTRKIDVIHIVHNSCFYDMLPEIKKIFPDIKVISTVFNTVASHFGNSIKYKKFVNLYTTDNTKVLKAYNQQLTGSNAKNIVIYNGIDCNNKFNPNLYNRLTERKKMGINDNAIAIYFIGRLSSEKNPDIFIKAAKKILEKTTGVKFFIIGDGIMRNEIEKLINKLNNKNLIYLGYQTDIPRYLSTADIFVLPSSAEGFPLSNIEAMSMGVCVIASDVGGVSDAIINGENGFLMKPNSVDELVNKIEFILNKKNILNKISKNARKSVEEKFSIEILAEKYKNLYIKINE